VQEVTDPGDFDGRDDDYGDDEVNAVRTSTRWESVIVAKGKK
jgi:hypothetical protein